MIDSSGFGIILKTLRLARGGSSEQEWTQEAVAKKLGVSRGTYNGWENDRAIPRPGDLKSITVLFKLTEEEEDLLYEGASSAVPYVCWLPPHNMFFTGRETYMQQIYQKFAQGKNTQMLGSMAEHRASRGGNGQCVVISGLAGIGKTQIALEYAYRAHWNRLYRAVFWIDAGSRLSRVASYRNIDKLLGLPRYAARTKDTPVSSGMPMSSGTLMVYMRQWLERHANWLLVIDNFDNTDDMPYEVLPPISTGDYLITTQSQSIRNIGAGNQIRLEQFSTEEGVSFLFRRTGLMPEEITPRLQQEATQAVAEVGGYALALNQIGAYIEDSGVSFDSYSRMVLHEKYQILKTYGAAYNSYGSTVAATIMLSFSRAVSLNAHAADIMYFCVSIGTEVVAEELLAHDEQLWIDNVSFNVSVSALRRYSLVERNVEDRTYSMHQLVRLIVLQSMPADLISSWRSRVILALFHISCDENDTETHQRISLYADTVQSWLTTIDPILSGKALAFLGWAQKPQSPNELFDDLHS